MQPLLAVTSLSRRVQDTCIPELADAVSGACQAEPLPVQTLYSLSESRARTVYTVALVADDYTAALWAEV